MHFSCMRQDPMVGDFVLTSLGKGFVQEIFKDTSLVKHGGCYFTFKLDEIKVLQTREERLKRRELKRHRHYKI